MVIDHSFSIYSGSGRVISTIETKRSVSTDEDETCKENKVERCFAAIDDYDDVSIIDQPYVIMTRIVGAVTVM